MKPENMANENLDQLEACETSEELSDEQLDDIAGGKALPGEPRRRRRRRSPKPLTREEIDQIEQLHQRLQRSDESE